MISEKRISQYIRIALSTISADRESKEKIRREMNYDIQNKVFDSGKENPFEGGRPFCVCQRIHRREEIHLHPGSHEAISTYGIGGHAVMSSFQSQLF
jgi:hypothetical protein